MGLIQATPGDMKSFKVSTERMADILKSSKQAASALRRWFSGVPVSTSAVQDLLAVILRVGWTLCKEVG